MSDTTDVTSDFPGTSDASAAGRRRKTGGGLAGAVAELLAREQPTRMVTIGVEDSFVEVVGDHADLLQHTGIQANEITRRVMTILYPLSDITAS